MRQLALEHPKSLVKPHPMVSWYEGRFHDSETRLVSVKILFPFEYGAWCNAEVRGRNMIKTVGEIKEFLKTLIYGL